MPVPYLPTEIIELIIEHIFDRKDLLNLNQVSKVCYFAARKRIWDNFSWSTEGGERNLYLLPTSVKSLIHSVNVWGEDYAQFPVLWTNEVYKLLRRLPSVDTLSIECTAVFEGSRREAYDIYDDSDEEYYTDDDQDHLSEDPASLQITHLNYFAGEIHIHSSLLQDILIKLPNVNQLYIQLEDPEMTRNMELSGSRRNSRSRIIPLARCPQLSTLSISSSEDPGLFNIDNPLIPYTSLSKLRRLELELFDLSGTNVLEIVKLARATLEVVIIKKWGLDYENKEILYWKYGDWKPIIPTLKVLKLFNIPIQDPPLEIMDILPVTLTVLQIPINCSHLIQLRNQAQPSLQLSLITLNHITTSDFVTLIPRSVLEIKIIRLESCMEQVIEIFEKIQEIGRERFCLRELLIQEVTRPEEKFKKEEQERFINRFRMIGIKLVVRMWTVYPRSSRDQGYWR